MLGLGLGVDKIRPSGVLPLLDLYPATAAYSLRALSSSTSNVVRVREDGTNTEQDFTAKEITDGTLATFCGANNGFVVTWYDQAGSNNATQATAGSQPKIYDSSTGVVLENGKPALDFDGSDDKLIDSFSLLSQPNTIFSVAQTSTIGVRLLYDDNNGDDRNTLSVESNGVPALFAGSALIGTGTWGINQRLHSALYNSTSSKLWRDGIEVATGDVGTQGLSGLTIGARFNVNFWEGAIQEIIIYNSDQSANRTAIESNINSHYNIYP